MLSTTTPYATIGVPLSCPRFVDDSTRPARGFFSLLPARMDDNKGSGHEFIKHDPALSVGRVVRFGRLVSTIRPL